jgi:hypothetical protein
MLASPRRWNLPGLVLLGGLGLLFPSRAEAGQFFVDPSLGSDSNPGTAALPFKTIHKALSLNPLTIDSVVLAPGVYSAASGELFPLSVGTVQIFGSGSAATTIVGAGNDLLFDARSTGAPGGTFLTLKGLSLQGGRTGLRITGTVSNHSSVLQDVVFTGLSQDGIEAHAIPSGQGSAQVSLFASQVTISGCLRGVSFESASPSEMSILSLLQCRFHDNTVGVDILANGTGDILAGITTTRIEDNALFGLRAFSNGGTAEVLLSSSLCARNGTGVEVGGLNAGTSLLVQSCTVADNTVAGVATATLPVPPITTQLQASIFWGNEDDVLLAGAVFPSFNDIGDGDFAGSNGNVSVDPLFRDAAAGDYRLSWGSPAIETAGEIFNADLDGNIRPADGDLDTVSEADMGALEFMALDLVSPPPVGEGILPGLPLGGTLRLESWGEAGATASVFVAPGGLFGPLGTRFGGFFLNPSLFLPVVTLPAGPTAPGVFEPVLPGAPALVGAVLSFQALTTSSVAPQGKALTDGVQFVITN